MEAPLLVVNHSSPVSPYEQISLQIRALIVSGQLHPGDRLPAVRQLAEDLGVAPNTVVRAYSELERDGWVASSLRRRTLIAPHPPVVHAEERRRKLEEAVQQLLITVHQLDVGLEEVYREIERQASLNAEIAIQARE